MVNPANNSNSPFGDKRTALAFFISLIVIITYTELIIKPTQPAFVPEEAATNNSISDKTNLGSAMPSGPVPLNGSSTGVESKGKPVENTILSSGNFLPTAEEIKASSTTTIITPRYKVVLTHLGARITSFTLSEHSRELGSNEPLDLVMFAPEHGYPMGINLLGGSDAKLPFLQPKITTDGVKQDNGSEIILKHNQEAHVAFEIALEGGATFTKNYRFVGGTFFVDLTAKLSEYKDSTVPLVANWSANFPPSVAGSSYDPVNFSLLLPNDKVEHLPVVQFEEQSRQEKTARWASIGDKYFMASFIFPKEAGTVHLERHQDNYIVKAVGSPNEVSIKAFLGPKNYSELKKLGYELYRNVNLGIFSILAIPLLTVISLFYSLLGNYGLAIILLTLLIKFLFLPLTQVSFKSMKAMQDMQPEIKQLRERVKDPTQLNQEIFALYKRKGVNPMGGCFPIFIQIPVFLGLYNALLNATELRHAEFALWINDLSAPEALSVFGVPIPVMIILMGISMFLQQYLTPSNMDEQQKKILLMMPIVFTVMFIIFPFPSGLVLYWLVNNLISIVQQIYLRSERGIGPTQATVLASVAIMGFGYFLTVL